jgi:hypothetical protein
VITPGVAAFRGAIHDAARRVVPDYADPAAGTLSRSARTSPRRAPSGDGNDKGGSAVLAVEEAQAATAGRLVRRRNRRAEPPTDPARAAKSSAAA